MADRNLLEDIKATKFFLIFGHSFHGSNLSRKVKGKYFRPVGSHINEDMLYQLGQADERQ